MLLFNTQRSNPCRVSLSVKHISMWCYRRLSCSWPWCLYSLAGLLTRTVVVKHEPETVCLQGKSWAFWNVLVTAVRHNFLLWRRVLCFSSSRHISHSFIAARLVFSLWVIWESLSVCVFIHKLSRTGRDTCTRLQTRSRARPAEMTALPGREQRVQISQQVIFFS